MTEWLELKQHSNDAMADLGEVGVGGLYYKNESVHSRL